MSNEKTIPEPHIYSHVSRLNWLRASVLGANVTRATLRIVFGGVLAMAVTYSVGKLFGVVGI